MAFQLEKCARCGKLFSRVSSSVCVACQAEEERDFAKIRKVLDRQTGLNPEQVAEEAQVSVECVLRMLDEGRIKNEDVGTPIKCGRCGAPAISASKRLCESCLVQLDYECAEAMREIRQKWAEERIQEGGGQAVRKTVDSKRRLPVVSTPRKTGTPLLPKREKTTSVDERQRMAIPERLRKNESASRKKLK